MTAFCESCGATLHQFRIFKQKCQVCGTTHKAKAERGSIVGLVYGLLFPVILIGGFWLPGPIWIPLVVIPLLLIVVGIAGSLATQRWIKG
ncbi:hypothetical protein [Arenimonas sp. MALMAid1274]|uniref:hypothetical protein n=1 Tax=Arenimonas sp. MALMAid1274 TaxID=3411630 RepID=UPI003BA39145